MNSHRLGIQKRVRETEIMPEGYGIAIYEYHTRMAICYPIPLNLVIRLLDAIYYWIKFPTPSSRERMFGEVYNKGFAEGINAQERRSSVGFTSVDLAGGRER